MKTLQILMLLTIWSCASQRPTLTDSTNISLSQEGLLATNWYQTSGEARALYIQGYNFAKMSFQSALKRKGSRKLAVIVDIDETVLDNSPYQAKLIEKKASYPMYWKEWVDTESARPLPGSLEFLRYVDSKGGTVFYITNRKENERQATWNNLKKFGFPLENQSQLLVRTNETNKTARRALIKKDHEVVLLVGDNLNDFDGIFEGKSVDEKHKLVNRMSDDFGVKFIMLPNPLYGDWEGALYNYNFKLSDKEKHEVRMKALRSF